MHSDKLQTLLFQKMSKLYDLAVHLFMVLLYIRSLKHSINGLFALFLLLDLIIDHKSMTAM